MRRTDESKGTILIVDDDEGIIRAIETRLQASGYRCRSARTGAQGRAIFAEEAIDVVITDHNMPLGDGAALAGSIREAGDVPIIVVTGFGQSCRRELGDMPVLAILEKPFEASELLGLIDGALRRAADGQPA